MKHLLELLESGTLGTRAEPSRLQAGRSEKIVLSQVDALCGTLGTHGTRDFTSNIEALRDAYVERIAICLADDIPGDEAAATAAAEVGAEFVLRFVPQGEAG